VYHLDIYDIRLLFSKAMRLTAYLGYTGQVKYLFKHDMLLYGLMHWTMKFTVYTGL